MMRRSGGRLCGRVVLALACLLGLAHCTAPPATIELIRERGELRVGTLNQPTTYYLGAHGPEGFEYELARDFATSIEVDLVMTVYPDESALRAALRSGEIDVVAAQTTWRGKWTDFALPSRPYAELDQLVVQRRGLRRPRSVDDLPGRRLVVSTGSPQAEALETLTATTGLPVTWTALPEDAAGGPLDEIVARRADLTIIDGPAFPYARQAYPEISATFELDAKRPVQWLVRRHSQALRAIIDKFLDAQLASGRLAELADPAGDGTRRMHYETARVFRAHFDARLPPLQSHFMEASGITGVDWRLLAAMGYQESRWDNEAVSPNGAQGIMMLMGPTAQSVGVADPHDPRDNIIGGAKYFVEVRDKIPARIREPDRTWLALAAYNAGYGHLEDARVITQMRGGDPDRWADVRESLPLLAQEAWYSRVKRGYARGWEPVQFVERVRQFLSVLEWRTLPPVETVYQLESEDPAPPTAEKRAAARS